MERVYNFSAGPAVMPVPVLGEVQKELLCYGNTGMSILEMSHRSKSFQAIIDEAEALLRKLMDIPQNYKVLFMQGGASLQFAAVPLNLMNKSKKADIAVTGQWAKKALEQGKIYGDMNVVASSADKTFSYIPKLDPSTFTPDADYFHITQNNTIYGTRYTELPEVGSVPLVSDFSSSILSEYCDVSKYGLIYAGAQKNIGPAGVCVVIIREDLIGNPQEKTPIMLNYQTYSESDSLYNTPPTFAIYAAMLVFRWLDALGGVSVIQEKNEEKAALLYNYLEQSTLFSSPVNPKDRSIMNVPFVTGSDELDSTFISGAQKKGLVNLKGHRSVGGMRASIYNAMPREGVVALIDYMKAFEKENGGMAHV